MIYFKNLLFAIFNCVQYNIIWPDLPQCFQCSGLLIATVGIRRAMFLIKFLCGIQIKLSREPPRWISLSSPVFSYPPSPPPYQLELYLYYLLEYRAILTSGHKSRI